MPIAAPRLDARLLDELLRMAATQASCAEIRRSLVRRARALRIAPPSYENVRRLVVSERERRASDGEYAARVLPVLVDVAFGVEHGSELVRVARGANPRRRGVGR